MLILGPLGQMPSLSTYTLLTLIFPIQEEPSEKYIISTLERAANQIVQAYPWLAGQVIVEKSTDENSTSSGIFMIKEYKPHEGDSKFLHVKDCKELCPSFYDLAQLRAPPSMLDGTIICPAYGFANFYPDHVEKPVTIMQANLIVGGLLLTICTHHCVMDANGNEQFIRQFAALCRGEQLSEEDIRIGNSDQNTIIPPLKPDQESHTLDMIRCPSSLGAPAISSWPPAPSEGRWKSFRFPAKKAAALKSQASTLCSGSSDIKYISTNDAVSAFIWSRVSAVRSAWLPKDSSSMLIRAVNGRKRLDPPLSNAYMGHTILCCHTSIPLQNVIEDDLSSTAAEIRRTLLGVDDRQVRSFFHLLQTEKDKTTINYGAKMNPAADIMITSFAAQKLYETDFGDGLGMPAFVRRPMLPDAQSLLYLMPTTREGDIDLIAGLSDDEFKGLLRDEKWGEYTELIG